VAADADGACPLAAGTVRRAGGLPGAGTDKLLTDEVMAHPVPWVITPTAARSPVA
jgi:hypothetical protein